VVVAALIDDGLAGRWAASGAAVSAARRPAPHAGGGCQCSAASSLGRRHLGRRGLARHLDLIALQVSLFPCDACARRVWELRADVTAYDAWYVALAEVLGAQLATLDDRLRRAPGPRCKFAAVPTDR